MKKALIFILIGVVFLSFLAGELYAQRPQIPTQAEAEVAEKVFRREVKKEKPRKIEEPKEPIVEEKPVEPTLEEVKKRYTSRRLSSRGIR